MCVKKIPQESSVEQITDVPATGEQIVSVPGERCSRGHWTFFAPGNEKKSYETLSYTPEGK